MEKNKKQALFIRLDRMGDLVLTLPCDHLVTKDYFVHWLIPQGLDFVLNSAPEKRDFSTWSSQWSWNRFLSLRKKIKAIAPQVSVSFHVPWWVNMALWVCGIKQRVGVLSQWHSYLFLNKGLRQKRSQGDAHEMEYNYQLVEYAFDLEKNPAQWTPLKLQAPLEQTMPWETSQNYAVVHPGMGGSALNWPMEAYAHLVTQLSKSTQVVITGTLSDEAYLTPLKKLLARGFHKVCENGGLTPVVWLDQKLDGYQLLKLLQQARVLIAPSTGVLHLGASLGTPSIGLYSPLKSHRAQRWGPQGKNTCHFTPSQGGMENLEVAPILEKALSYLEGGHPS